MKNYNILSKRKSALVLSMVLVNNIYAIDLCFANGIIDINQKCTSTIKPDNNQKIIVGINGSIEVDKRNSDAITITSKKGVSIENNSKILSSNKNGISINNNSHVANINNKHNGFINGREDGIEISNSSTVNNINNNGTIKGNKEVAIDITHNSKVDTINNHGLIHGGKYGIDVTNNSSVGSIYNHGNIKGKHAGIEVHSNSTVDNIHNHGNIQAMKGIKLYRKNSQINTIINYKNANIITNEVGIELQENTKINYLNNQGKIQGANGIKVSDESHLGSLVNSGQIVGTGIYQGPWFAHSGIEISGHSAKIDSIINQANGIIKGTKGIYIHGGSIGQISNNGIIQGTTEAGIGLYSDFYYTNSSINTINNTGEISSIRNSAIVVNTGASIDNIHNKGNIHGAKDGIELKYNKDSTNNLKTSIKSIQNENLIYGKNNGINIASNGNGSNQFNIENIINSGNIIGENANGIYLQKSKDESKPTAIKGITLKGDSLIQGGQNGINNESIIGDKNNKTTSIDLQSGSIQGIKHSGILNNGQVYGNISLGANASILGKKYGIFNNDLIDGNISNQGVISGEQSGIYNNSTINGSIFNSNQEAMISAIHNNEKASLESIENQGTIYLAYNEGTIKEHIKNDGFIDTIHNIGSIKGNIQNNAKITNIINDGIIEKDINLGKNSHTQNIINNGTIKEGISIQEQGKVDYLANTGYIKNITSKGDIQEFVNTGTIESDFSINGNMVSFANAGNINSVTSKGDIREFVNTGSILTSINNEGGSINIINHGNIKGGIINKEGTVNINNFTPTPTNSHKGFNGNLGKTDGYHIKNENGATTNIKGWFFDNTEYTTNEERKENSIIVDGDINGIHVEKVVVSTTKVNVVYDSNTFVADKDGKAIGDQVNNGQGITINNLEDITGLFDFVRTGEKGQYKVKVNNNETSGKTLIKSSIYSARLRAINISNMLKDINGKTFGTDFSQVDNMNNSKHNESYGNNADLINELDQTFLTHKNYDSEYFTFAIPYHSYSTINISPSLGKIKNHTSGILTGVQKKLSSDDGILGVYLGYEGADRIQSIQRLSFDDTTYYGGLSYYNIFARDGIKEFFISAGTKFDYTQIDIDKKYKLLPESAKSNSKSFSYGGDIKIGVNLYDTANISMLSPEIGLNYQGMSFKNFSIRHINGLKEHYYASQVNFLDTTMAVKWQKPWSDKVRSTISVGGLINLYNDADSTTIQLADYKNEEDISTAKWFAYTQVGLSYAISNNIDLSLNYGGVFNTRTRSHAVYLKAGLWW
ncbi:autotransporter outer membrane beta-barrel domain-containing protein [Campylobacter lari]|uniref:autotransporter outer membrane beta-barrel domain-containing protein n=1 Tax=Campylobacter lari TaxID=201 RepID=UPI0021F7182C|nr:autotransporter outer membrane beta-barrel domain-containing protein [Campylobacter lari]EKK0829805.1 autotransporter outer membrane beta-barrel domain-containing protein [Campylobacter lari]MCW0221728.1 autotransporter outer membrane beta-barrel domain-containing protein [Campylobacter lari]